MHATKNSEVEHIVVFFYVCVGPSAEYVVSLRAFNNVGEGIPIYETTVTRDDSCMCILSHMILFCLLGSNTLPLSSTEQSPT